MTKFRTVLSSLTVAGATLGALGTAHASGFLLNEFDAAEVGRGNASTASDVNASSIYYNVGGLAVGTGGNVIVSGALVAPSASFTDSATGTKTNSDTDPQPLPAAFLSYRISDMFAAGIGFYTPYGLANDWPSSSPQANVVESVTLHSFYITPAAGANLSSIIPGLSVGAGLDIVPASIELTQAIYFGADTPGNAHLGATATGVGWRAGAMYRPGFAPGLSIGLSWHSNVTENFSGTGNFTSLPQYRQMLPGNGDIKATLNLPETITGGASYRPIPAFEIEADVAWTEWSKLQSLDITVPAAPSMSGTQVIATPQNYKDTTSIRVGAEYDLRDLGLALRAGYIYDPSPVPTTTLTALLPDVDRNDICLGASKWFGEYAVHLGLLEVLPTTRSTSTMPNTPEYKGSFDVSAFVASLSLSGRWR